MAIYKEKSTGNALALTSIFDAVDSHFGPTLWAAPDFSLSSLNSPSLAASQIGPFRLNRKKSEAVKTLDFIESRPYDENKTRFDVTGEHARFVSHNNLQ